MIHMRLPRIWHASMILMALLGVGIPVADAYNISGPVPPGEGLPAWPGSSTLPQFRITPGTGGGCAIPGPNVAELPIATPDSSGLTAPTASTTSSSKTLLVCKPLSKNQLLAFQDAILQKETSFYNQHCTMNNGGCQDNIGDPAAPEAFTPTDLKSTSGYTLIPIGASGGGSQELYSNQLYYLVQNYNNKAVISNCEAASPNIQSAPAFSMLVCRTKSG